MIVAKTMERIGADDQEEEPEPERNADATGKTRSNEQGNLSLMFLHD